MKNRNLDHKDDWATPPYVYDKLNEEFDFDFDPCPLGGPEVCGFDGLTVPWGSRNFVNPGYSLKVKESFVFASIVEMANGNLCVLLLPVSTSTKLFHNVIKPNAKEIRFVEGRIPFIGINSKGQRVNWHLKEVINSPSDKIIFEGKEYPMYVKNSGQHDSMIVVFDGCKK